MIKKYGNGAAEFEEILKMPPEIQRYQFFTKKMKRDFAETGYSDTDDKLVFFNTKFLIGFNNRLYRRPVERQGFTYDKTTKKLLVWKGTDFNKMHRLKDFLKDYGLEWVVNEGFDSWLTKGLLEKILKGKITNPSDACKHIITYQRLGKTVNRELLRLYIKNNRHGKGLIFRNSKGLKDINPFLAAMGSHPQAHTLLHDMVDQALALGKTVDFNWSQNRLREEHSKMTRELMGIEAKFLETNVLVYKHLPQLPKEWQILDSALKVFEEGTNMKHCLYTNYWRKIRLRAYMAYHWESPEGGVTVGIRINYRYGGVPTGDPSYSAVIDQFFKIGNTPVSKDTENILRETLEPVLSVLAENGEKPVSENPPF